jgi:uncharacterized protein (DUF849 family)
MSRPVVIACAITGSRPIKADNPAVPVSPDEQIESTHAAFEAGAALVHLHVRDADGRPSQAVDRFARVHEGLRRHCPGMIVQFSIDDQGASLAERDALLALRPDMASLAIGTANLPSGVHGNPPQVIEALTARMHDLGIRPEIEILDLSMLYAAKALIDSGLMVARPHVRFVLGAGAALPAKRPLAEFLISELRDVIPRATFTFGGIGRFQEPVMGWSLSLGGHLRTGLEDNIRISRDVLAESNAQLVERAARLCVDYGALPATPAEAREILDLEPAAVA